MIAVPHFLVRQSDIPVWVSSQKTWPTVCVKMNGINYMANACDIERIAYLMPSATTLIVELPDKNRDLIQYLGQDETSVSLYQLLVKLKNITETTNLKKIQVVFCTSCPLQLYKQHLLQKFFEFWHDLTGDTIDIVLRNTYPDLDCNNGYVPTNIAIKHMFMGPEYHYVKTALDIAHARIGEQLVGGDLKITPEDAKHLAVVFFSSVQNINEHLRSAAFHRNQGNADEDVTKLLKWAPTLENSYIPVVLCAKERDNDQGLLVNQRQELEYFTQAIENFNKQKGD